MTYVPGISQGYTTANAAAAQQKNDQKGDKLGLNDFLTLLVAQLQNQDPLNPTDATKFTAQLTQYSQLEQSINMNNNIKELLNVQKSSDRLSALSLIDKRVLVQGARFQLGEGDAEIGYKVNDKVDDLTISIRNQSGATVATLHPSELDPGNHLITWDGLDKNGDHLPAGTYEIAIETPDSGKDKEQSVVPLVYTDVTGVDMSGDKALLQTRSGDFNLSAVQGVYENDRHQTEPSDAADNTGAETTDNNVAAATTDGAGILDNSFISGDIQGTEAAGTTAWTNASE